VGRYTAQVSYGARSVRRARHNGTRDSTSGTRGVMPIYRTSRVTTQKGKKEKKRQVYYRGIIHNSNNIIIIFSKQNPPNNLTNPPKLRRA